MVINCKYSVSLLGPSSLIAISMFGASDISPFQSVGVSIQFRPTGIFLSDIEIGRAIINADIAKTVTGKF